MKYRTIVADPPWPYQASFAGDIPAGTFGGAPMPYELMPVSAIAALDVAAVAARDAHLYLWTVNRFVRDAYDVAEAWGFNVDKPLVWCKDSRGWLPGGTFYSNAEFCLFCSRGTPRSKKRVRRQWFQWPRGEHSKKPNPFFHMVTSVSHGPYLELFARTHRSGWECWGDQVMTLDEDVTAVLGSPQAA